MAFTVAGVSWGAAAGMAVAALLMVLTPGPNMMYLVSRSITQGRTAGLISLAGTGVGFLVYLCLATLGLAALFIAVPWIFVALKAAGVGYLAYLAWKILRPGGIGVFDTAEMHRDPVGKLFRMGLITNLLNPKTALMYVALIPQFVDTAAGSTALQGFTLGSIQIMVSLIVNTVIVVAAGSIAGFLARRPAWNRRQRRITGGLLGVVAVSLASELPHAARA